jgi:hypothetical protein
MRTALLLLCAQACYKAPPLPPVAPIPLEPFSRTIDLPNPMIADEFQIHTVPRIFPLTPPASIVVAVPLQTGGESDTERNEVRAGLIAAFLEAGFQVKDAGVVGTPILRIQHQPAYKGTSAVEFWQRSEGVELELVDPQAAAIELLQPLGLDMDLVDPTSLWASDLADHPDLAATHFFRVFEIDVSEQQRGIAGRLYYSSAQIDAFEARAAPLNTEAGEWFLRRQAFAERTLRFHQEHAAYRLACQAWVDRWPPPSARRGRTCERAPVVPDPPPVPQLFSRQTLQQYLDGSGGASTTRVVGRMLAELVETGSGEVVWVGRTEVEVDPGPNAHARVIALMLTKLRGG